jgi:hypothetical protein
MEVIRRERDDINGAQVRPSLHNRLLQAAATIREWLQGIADPAQIALRVLCGLFLLFALLTLWWLHLHRAPPSWDDASYLANSLRLYDAWHTGGFLGLGRSFLVALGLKAPLIIALPLPFYWIFGRRWHMAFLVNIVAMLVLFISIYKVGERLRSRRTGLVAVYVTGTLPLLYGLARWYMVEYAMTAMVAAAYWLALIAADDTGTTTAIALGVICGFGLLLKASFPLFVFPVLIYSVWHRPGARPKLVLSILLPSLGIAAPWYLLHWRATLDNAIDAAYGASGVIYGTGPIFSFAAISAYLRIVSNSGVSLYYVFVAIVASAVLICERRRRVSGLPLPLVLWYVAFFVFLFGGNKDVRFIAPILPAFALTIAWILDAAGGRFWATAVVLVFPFLSLLSTSFGWPYEGRDVGYAQRYDANTWGQSELLDVISKDLTYRYGEQKMILVTTDRGHFNGDNFQLAVVERRLPIRVETTAYDKGVADAIHHAGGAAYVIYKEGGEAESPFFNKHSSQVMSELRRSQDWVELPFSVSIPDGGSGRIFRHRADLIGSNQ